MEALTLHSADGAALAFREQFRATLWPRSLHWLQGLQLHHQETAA
jgi:hypothetical protein